MKGQKRVITLGADSVLRFERPGDGPRMTHLCVFFLMETSGVEAENDFVGLFENRFVEDW